MLRSGQLGPEGSDVGGGGPSRQGLIRELVAGIVNTVRSARTRIDTSPVLLSPPELIDGQPSRLRNLAVALVVARVIAPAPKLATARGLRAETASSSLGQVLGVGGCDEDEPRPSKPKGMSTSEDFTTWWRSLRVGERLSGLKATRVCLHSSQCIREHSIHNRDSSTD